MRDAFRAMVLALLLPTLAWAGSLPDTPRFRYFGVAEGLPSRVVYAMAQDHAGYLWFATGDGLARFDGQDWDVYRHDPEDPSSIPGNSVIAIEVDDEDTLWLGLEGMGLARLDASRQRFEHLTPSHPEGFAGPYVWAIRQAADGALWVGTFQDGLFRRTRDGDVQRFMPDPTDPRSLPSDIVLSLQADPDGRMWVATAAGAVVFEGDGFMPVDLREDDPPLIVALGMDAAGRPWLGQRDRLQRLHADGRVERIEVGHTVNDFHDPEPGLGWLATGQGLGIVRHGQLRDGAYGHPLLARAQLQQILVDREGSVWIVGMGGVWQLAPGWQRFASFTAGDTAGLSAELVRGMAEDGANGLWLASTHGLDHLDLATGAVRRGATDFPGAGVGLWALARDAQGRLWMGRSGELVRYDPTSDTLERWPAGADPAASVMVGPADLLHLHHDGELWVVHHGGGIHTRDADGHVTGVFEPGGAGGLPWPDPEQVAEGPDGRVWVAGATGLMRHDPDRGFVPVEGSPEDRIYTFGWASRDTVWLHRFTALEAYRWDGDTLTLLERIDSGGGLDPKESGGVLVAEDGSVWLTTPRGLLRRDAGGRLRTFGLRDGLPAQDFSTRPMLALSDGRVAAPSQGGLVLFDTRFSDVEAGEMSVLVKQVAVRRDDTVLRLDPDLPIQLRHDDRELQVSARLLSFVDPAGHRFRMRLSGHDADWVGLGSSGERTFSRLPAGQYTLEIQALDGSGRWSASRKLELSVSPPWWLSTWAWGLWALLAALLVSWALSVYRHRLRRRHALDLAEQQRLMAERASQAKTEFLATLGHEVRTPMTGVLGMSELLLESKLDARQHGQVSAIHRAGQHLLRLVNDALDLARIEAGKLRLEREPFLLRELVDEVCALLRPLAEKKGLSFDCDFSAGLPAAMLGDQYRVRQILLNLGSNAIKFTEHGGVSIDVRRDEAWLQMAVRDTGPGLNAEQRERLFQRFEQAHDAAVQSRVGGSGLGLAISQELAAAMGGHIRLESMPGQGTCFEVRLPLEEAPAPAVAPGQDVGTGSDSDQLRILLVEDDPIVAEVIVGLLEAQGHTVEHAPHGLAALGRLSSTCFDLALLDLDLPGLHGTELARLIRQQGHGLPLLAITARADAGAEPAAREAGMDAFLRKPLTARALRQAVAALKVSAGGS